MAAKQNGMPHKVNPYKRNKEILEWFDSLVLCMVVLAVVFTILVRVVRVDGHSMEPSLWDGERLVLQTTPYTPQYGDVVVVDSYTSYGRPLVKRVIGLSGDTIDIDFVEGVVYRNGQQLEEPYIAAPTWTYEGVDFPLTVPEGTLFIMGDNRNNSKDSRSEQIGCVDERDILGKALYRILPLNRAGAIK